MIGLRKNLHRALEDRLGIRFKNQALLEEAITHPSFRHESGGDVMVDNQRLEFLGDAVLGLMAASYLYQNYPNKPEGEMTKLRSSLTNSKTLARIGAKLELGQSLRLGRGEENSGGRERASNLCDAVEAIIGAAFSDKGMKPCEAMFQLHFIPILSDLMGNKKAANPKGALQERLQALGTRNPSYYIIQVTGPQHERYFTAGVSLNGNEIGTGGGTSKRDAEMNAAREALERFLRGDLPETISEQAEEQVAEPTLSTTANLALDPAIEPSHTPSKVPSKEDLNTDS